MEVNTLQKLCTIFAAALCVIYVQRVSLKLT